MVAHESLTDWAFKFIIQKVEEVGHAGERNEVSADNWESSLEEIPDAFFFRNSHESIERRGVSLLQFFGVSSVSIIASSSHFKRH